MKNKVLCKTTVAIAGGGPSGFAAAIAAARQGADVLLIEQTGALGGMATSGLIPMFAPTTDHTKNIYGGIFEEIVEEMCRQMNEPRDPESWQPIDPEILKRILDQYVEKYAVKVLFGAKVCEVEVENQTIKSLYVATVNGLRKIEADIFIDGTGDGLLAMLAGADFAYGDDKGAVMSPTLCGRFANIDFDATAAAARNGIYDGKLWWELMEKNIAPLQEYHFVCMRRVSEDTATSNLGHIYGTDTLDEFSLSRAYIEGRRQLKIFEDFYRQYVPGFEKVELTGSAALLGVRETRRVKGDYELVFDDFVRRANFDDGIGRCCYPVDIHSSSTDAEEQKRVDEVMKKTAFKAGESYGIPYRAMCPVGLKNLLVPGRALCADRSIQSSLRVMPPCFVTGQAAGVAAAMAAAKRDIRQIDIAALRQKLLALGAIL